ncbi:MAG: flagellin [Lachnospiraceae bacterium]|nr:flagellin [Lachnospiraceae bacterium]
MTYEETIHTGYYTYFDRWDGDQIWIQASDETPDGLSILDRHLSAEGLGLGNYRIDTYRTEVTMDDPEGYRKKLAEWVAAAPEPVVTSYQKEVTTTVMTKPAEYKYWTEIVAGEERKFSKLISPAQFTTQKTMQTFYVTTYPNDTRGPKPKPTYKVREIYNPSDLKLVDNALETISKVRSYYGAVQNRLEHTYNNNYNAMENMTYAESQLRDTDMAEETVRKSMLDILQQAGFSMLSQANQSKQGVSMLLS